MSSGILTQELETLNLVFCDELEMKSMQNFMKLHLKINPLLEEQNIDHHYEYDHPFLFLNIEVPNDYPEGSPSVHLESTHSRVVTGTFLAELTIKIESLIKALQGETCLLDVIEMARVSSF